MTTKSTGVQAVLAYLQQNETILASTECYRVQYHLTAEAPYQGVLVATETKLIFYSDFLGNPQIEEFPYEKISKTRVHKNWLVKGKKLIVNHAGEQVQIKGFLDSGIDQIISILRNKTPFSETKQRKASLKK
ncbi:PH domain-containing protein [Priestia koreensis]|uniref:PH domain-containing protein n=1 Tax=Priestia koreensis TaxID=284581 RepID=UPI0006A9F269|nr:PH domain-containing protein [Priestia koreensis]